MNAIDRATETPLADQAETHPRIRYSDPLGAEMAGGLEQSLARTAALGFTAVLVPPPWAPGASGDRFSPVSLERVHPGLGGGSVTEYMRALTRCCRQHGLQAMIDLPLGSLDAAFEGEAGPFSSPAGSDVFDPRSGGSGAA